METKYICMIPLNDTLEKTNLIYRNRNSVGCLGLGLGGLIAKVTRDLPEGWNSPLP